MTEKITRVFSDPEDYGAGWEGIHTPSRRVSFVNSKGYSQEELPSYILNHPFTQTEYDLRDVWLSTQFRDLGLDEERVEEMVETCNIFLDEGITTIPDIVKGIENYKKAEEKRLAVDK